MVKRRYLDVIPQSLSFPYFFKFRFACVVADNCVGFIRIIAAMRTQNNGASH